jgi:hypothetical protein
MKALKTKVILSAFVLLFALAATVGSTYAWFTVSQTVTLSEMQLKVQSVDSLLIRIADPAATAAVPVDTNLDQPSTYSTSLSTYDILDVYSFGRTDGDDDIWGTGDDTPVTWTLSDVTAVQATYASKDAKTLNKMAIGDPWLRTSMTPTTSKNGEGNDFIELKFWLYSQAAAAKAIAVKELAITTVGDNSDDQDNVVNAVRMGVWGDDGVTNGNAFIFGIDNDYDFKFTSAYATYYSTVAGDLEGAGDKVIGTDPFNFIDQTVSTIGEAADHVFYVSSDPVSLMSTTTLGDATTIYTIEPETPTLVTVRLYIEGWDSDMTNFVSASIFDIAFSFGFKA